MMLGKIVAASVAILVIVAGAYYLFDTQDHDDSGDGYTYISTVEELADIGEDGKYRLSNNIDISRMPWIPKDGFKGELDGDGFKIIGMNVDNNDSSAYAGMFKVLESEGYVHDITFVDANILSGHSGVVAGLNKGKIENVSVYGFVGRTNGISCGGIAGVNEKTITDSQNNATVDGLENIGGICGLNRGTVESCVNEGTVSGSYQDSGGISGYSSGTIKLCTNDGPVFSKGNHVGGICGKTEDNKWCNTEDSTNNGAVNGNDYVGGCIGVHKGTAKNVQNHGDVSGSTNVGGTFAFTDGHFSECSPNNEKHYSVIGVENVGGYIGYYGGSVTGVILNNISIVGSKNVGGIIGFGERASISNSEFRGIIISKTTSGSDNSFGGIIGYLWGKGTISNCVNYSNITVDGHSAGGILGTWKYIFAEHAYVKNCTNYGNVTASGNYCAGIVGSSYDFCSIQYNSNEGTIHGYNYVYGISNKGSFTGNTNVGSIITDKV